MNHLASSTEGTPRRLLATTLAVLALCAGGHTASHAGTVYLPSCFACALSTMPPAGDEWVIQGQYVHIGLDGLVAEGALRNEANYLSNAYGLTVKGGLQNNKWLLNSGALQLAYGVPNASFGNTGTTMNLGSITAQMPFNNLAGRLINQGSIEAYETVRNVGTIINSGTFKFYYNRLTNEAGASIDNTGVLLSQYDAFIDNKGVLRNRVGALLGTAGVSNSGVIINEGVIDGGFSFRNLSGSKLINRGTITLADSLFELAQGSDYDFTGGTFVNSSALGRMVLNRDFTFGVAKAGTVKLEFGSTLRNYAHMTIAKGYKQDADGDIVNNEGGLLDNLGTLSSVGLYNHGKFVNSGTLDVRDGMLNFSDARNLGTIVLSTGWLNNDTAGTLTNLGKIVIGNGGLNNAGIFNNGGEGKTGTLLLDRADAYDFTGGTLNNRKGGVIELWTPFTLGEAKSGTVNLQAGGQVKVESTLTNAAGHTQANSGLVTIIPGGRFVNEGALVNQGQIEVGGRFVNKGSVQGTGSLRQSEGYTEIAGSTNFSNVDIQRGQLLMQSGGNLQAKQINIGFMASVRHGDGAIIKTTGGMTVAGAYRFVGAGGTIQGSVANSGNMLVDASRAVFQGKLSNSGEFKSTGGSVSVFQDLIVTGDGWLNAGADDYQVSGNFLNGSLRSGWWHTNEARLTLTGKGWQTVSLAGADKGASRTGYQDNFAWSELVLGASSQYLLTDGNGVAGGALYVGQFTLKGGLTQLSSINSPFNVYYDAALAGNAYLGGKTYAFGQGGGHLIGVSDPVSGPSMGAMGMPTSPTAVPEPEALTLMLAGGLLVVTLRRRAA